MFRQNAYRVSLSVMVAGVALNAATLCQGAVFSASPAVKPADEASGLITELRIAEAELAACNARITVIKGEISQLEADIAKLYTQYMLTGDPALGAALDVAMGKVESKRSELAETEARANELEKKIATLKAKIFKAKQRTK